MTDRGSGCAKKDSQRAGSASGLKVIKIAAPLKQTSWLPLSTIKTPKQKPQCGKRYQIKNSPCVPEIFISL